MLSFCRETITFSDNEKNINIPINIAKNILERSSNPRSTRMEPKKLGINALKRNAIIVNIHINEYLIVNKFRWTR